MDSVLVSRSNRPVTDDLMRLCKREIDKLEGLHARTSVVRVTLAELSDRARDLLYEVHVVVSVPGCELVVRRRPPRDTHRETVDHALRSAFGKIRRQVGDYWSRRIQVSRRA